MAMSTRAKWMAQLISDVFLMPEYDAHEIFRNPKHQPTFEGFFKGTGPARIFLYYQTAYKILDNGDIVDYGTREEIYVTDGEKEKLKGKGIFFFRTTPPGKPVNTNGSCDNEVLFGEISENTVHSLNIIINSIYKPLVDKLDASDWGVCEEEYKKEFTQVFDKFASELKEALKSLRENISLEPYDQKRWGEEVKNIQTSKSPNQEMILEFEKLFDDWSQLIEKNLEDAEGDKKEDKDAGPRQELEYWRKRMRRLTGISEQLRSKNCRTVYDVLTQASQNPAEQLGKPRDKIYLATSKWRSIELRVTEALNEAKDNVKYLATLEKFIEPLYDGTPETIKDTLPALMNSIKMIHTIARYYNTNDRMTGLFVKITNQMINNCKHNILNFKKIREGNLQGNTKRPNITNDDLLWENDNYPPEELIPVLKSCLDLNQAYQKQYEITKDRLMNMPKGKQFEFSPNQIFGKFDLFCRRVSKLIELFGTIQQFKTLEKHNLEGISNILTTFYGFVSNFKKKNHKLLDYHNNTFDRDFVEFNVDVSSVETELQQYIDKNFEVITSIEDSLKLLKKFQTILQRDNLRNSLNSKYTILFHNYGKEIHEIEDQYQKYKNNPPIVRNLPTVSGSITWSRHLFHRISGPMEQFPQNLIKQKDSKKFVKMYNKIGYTLFSFEYLWRQKWAHEVEKAKAGLQATLIIRHPDNNKLYVNFDSEILTLIREAKCLSRIGIDIPESAKIVLLQEDKFKMYNNELQFVLREYDRIVNKIRPNTKSLLVPHLEDLEYKLRPGMVTLTWTSMNIDGYLHHVHQGLAKLEQLIININDIMENRIENNLKALSKTVLVNLPQDAQTFTLDDFVEMQEIWIRDESQKLKSKNYEVEGAVEDLIQTICSYQLDQHVEPISAEEIQKLSKYYNWSMYQALLHATKYSLNQMKERICGRRNAPKQILKPFFEVDVHLEGDTCSLRPSLEEVQSAINRAASHVLKSTKHVQNWNQKDQPEDQREPFYDWIAKDKEIVKVILLLTGSIQGTKNNVKRFLDSFEAYDWLWKQKVDESLKRFNSKNPTLEDFEEKLKEFVSFEDQVNKIESFHQIGALSLKTENVKTGLKKWIEQWKEVFSRDLHKKAKSLLEHLTDDIKQIRLKIEKPAKDIDSLGSVMHALEEIRKKESEIELQFRPVTEMYSLLETYLPEVMEKEEMDAKSILEKDWAQLVIFAENIRNELQGQQAEFKKSLIQGINYLIVDVEDFRKNFEKNGPMVPGIEPKEALNRLRMFSDEYSVRKRKYDSYFAGETLFGLPHQSYPALEETRKEIELLDKLYNLYSKVKDTIGKWRDVQWTDIQNEIGKMMEQIDGFGRDCMKLPGVLKTWDAYKELKQEIDDMTEILPLVEQLAKLSIRPRHWEDVISLTKEDIPYASETFTLSQLLKANLLGFKEDIEDITDSADKQLKLENQLRDDITKYWEDAELEIKTWKGVDVPCTLGGNIQDIQDKLEEHIMTLNQMNAMRYVTPFKSEVNEKISQLSEVADIIEKWLKVQTLWTNLVSVFTSGDIAKQMPTESKIFKGIDKQWLKIMERANEQKNVIACCTNDILKNSLTQLQQGLEICQKKLENYLETKRNIFPRFYFCSNADLLKILSVGSDPSAVQDDFEKLFDAISRVEFDEHDRRLITSIKQLMGSGATDYEEIILAEGVKAEGNIEDWLCKLEKEMQKSVREVCRRGAKDCLTIVIGNTKDFIDAYPSQIALLGIQMVWTFKVQDCLERNQKDKLSELDKKKKDINGIMQDLTNMCLDPDMNKLKRMKVETLVTVHVHQRDLFQKILDEAKQHKIRDANDFDWTKNTRIYWKTDEEHVAVQITDVEFIYSYEFLGAKERLCITPLTDRCYITLSQALGMLYGGAPAGPAGTGKTETVKDLGRTLGIFVVVTNCSDEHKYRDMAKIFKGLCQSGLWGCFDEFNRISLATLSVVAAQVESITLAKKQKLKKFMFPNEAQPITLIQACGYFITMNPGYAGRQELPENLKVQFRSVSMMMPNRQVIIKVKLASVGYSTYEPLSKKFNVLYKLCEEQLSKQRHYDFGLRNILSVLRTAGNIKRTEAPGTDEEMILARTLRDMNLSKLVAQDEPLFQQLLRDIFPRQSNIPKKIYKDIESSVNAFMKQNNLVDRREKTWFLKIIQLYETSLVRHGFMVVGPVGSGKTTIMNALTEAMTNLGNQHKITRMNPKSITGQQMYGVMNNITGEWVPGVFSQIWKKCNDKKNKHSSWIVCDGPVDAIWIENLNTVLDDNKILTLANAERIPMIDVTKMVFEVENLNNASPATVSRCGIVYISESDLNWEPVLETWLKDRQELKQYSHPEEANWINEFQEKYIVKPDLFLNLIKNFTYVMYTPPVVRINHLINLMTALTQQFLEKQEQLDKGTYEKFYVYCLAWSFGGLFETEEREKFHKFLDERKAPLPPISAQKMSVDKETVFDYYVDPNTKQWKQWEAEQWQVPKRLAFSQLLIPTIDSTRAEFIIQKIANLPLMRSEKRKEPGQLSTLLVGGPGTAKTSVILMYTSKFNKDAMLFKRINFSSNTTPYNFQESIESEVERKQSRTFVPPGGKKMTVFLDDMSMPFVNDWGDQITLEISRQLIDQKGFYFLSKDDRGYFRQIEGLQYLGAMNHPGGGRNDIPHRLKRQFFSINMTSPSQRSIENIYGKILEVLFSPKRYSQEVVNMKNLLIDGTIALWEQVKRRIMPTPAKFHYVFNIRELARVFQGICQVAQKYEYGVIKNTSALKEKIRSELFLVGLWRHECERVFEDKLINYADKKIFHDMMDRVTKEKYRDSLGFDDEQLITTMLFADFQRNDVFNEYGELTEEAPFVYEAVPDIESIKTRVNKKLEAYNEKYPSKKMNLVIFDDALRHLLRITRIINSPRGNCLLVGVGGSGKQSLTKLSSFICKQLFFQISLSKSYGENNLKDDIKNLYREAGPLGKQVSFIMTDSEIKTEDFLESINSMLATGEIAGLIPKDERDVFALETKNVYMKEVGTKGEDPSTLELWIYFINRVRDCLHMVLAFSPVGNKFRERARKFPSLFSQCTIDWFLPWPEEALISVSNKFLKEFTVDCSKDTKAELEKHMGKVHDLVTEVCDIYFQRMRRYVYVTPKSYLSFIDQYKLVYKTKFDGLNMEEQNIRKGLERLKEAAEGVEELKIDLKKEDAKLKEASDITDKLLKELEVENRKAKIKADEVSVVAEKCIAQRNQIMIEKEEADKDLQQALPYLRKAESAVDSIKPKDIVELKGTRNAVDTARIILDTVNILLQGPLTAVQPKTMTIQKMGIEFIQDSFDEYTKNTLVKADFLKSLLDFSQFEKDNINEETIEVLEPYLTLKFPNGDDIFTGQIAKKSSAALEGMCVWAAAMSDYHKQSKIVKPKLRFLEIKTASLQEAEANLAGAQAELDECNALKAKLKQKFDDQMAEKNALQEKAAKTRKKMDQANRLINSLQDNKVRWEQNVSEFKSLKSRLVGDVAKACAFVSYCGPFNAEFRLKLLDEYFHEDLIKRNIPTSLDLELTKFLVDDATVGEWNLEGLPSDDLSIQNGIMVTRSSRYPLMIDPQGQAMSWIKRREPELLEKDCIFTLNHPSLKDALKWPLQEGYPVLIESIENEVDPMLDPLLEKQIIVKGKSRLIKLADQDMDYDPKFRLYMTSRLANPHFSPELAAKATIIDFTVTQGGLEQQLLGRLISKEQKSLEEQLTTLQEEVTMNTKTLQSYEKQLLERLASVQGSLLDDQDLIDVLATIKNKAKEVTEKLSEARDKKIEINEKREQFRMVASRGSVLYFCIVEMILVNWMYNTSLQQFLELFDFAIDHAPKAQLIKDRVHNITMELTRKVYKYINRGLFERDKVTFKLMMAMKILIKEGKLTTADVNMLLKAGSGIDDRNKPFGWLEQKSWLNLKALSKHKFANEHTMFFKELPDRIGRNEQVWKKWIDENEPELIPVPDYEEKINADQNIGHFIHLCLIRSLREDRCLLGAIKFIKKVLGDEYVQPATDSIQQLWEESRPNKPILYLLSPGADPNNNIDEFAKKKKQFPTGKVSMGEEMEKPALEMIRNGFIAGKWVILNNCHLSLEFMAQMEEILFPKNVEIHEDFRLWITCEPHEQFPLGLLQIAIKVTTEPPKGLQAGLYRTFTTMINQDFLEKVEPYDKWRALVFTTCFMHSIVQERRKFGALGFCIPYEFNNADLEASLMYIDKHLSSCASLNIAYSWKAIQYMVAEVQYGGRITDDLDRELFITYGSLWLNDNIFQPNYPFNSAFTEFQYQIPDCIEHVKFLEYIQEMPPKDSPIIFGLHPNADLTFRLKESLEMINTLVDTQPKEASSSGGRSREDEVKEKLEKDLLPTLPPDFIEAEYEERLKLLKAPKGLTETGKQVPLNVFLFQEIQRFQMVLSIVRRMMLNMIDAIEGTIIMTPDLVDAINAIYDFRVPRKWCYDPTGAEISWLTPSLAGWIKGLLDRHYQLNNWISKERPPSFWLTGFFNPQGFLTAVKQEVTRQKKALAWSLDEVDYSTDVLREVIPGDDGRIEGRNINPPAEGVYIHGLYLEGAGWNKANRHLEDSQPKEIFYPFPIMHVSATSTAPQTGPGVGGARAKPDDRAQEKSSYSCPVYKYPKRTDKYLVFRVFLKCDAQGGSATLSRGVTPAMNWKLKAVSLLCCKE